MKILKYLKVIVFVVAHLSSIQDCNSQNSLIGKLKKLSADFKEGIDSTYVGSFEQNLSAKYFVGTNIVSAKFRNDLQQDTYKPNLPVNTGISIGWGVLKVGVSYGLDFTKDKNKGKSEFFNSQISFYTRRIAVDLVAQSHKGFYSDNDEKSIMGENIKLVRLGGLFQYVFNNKRYSYSAGFGQSQKQLKSAGSFLIGTNLYYTKIEKDSTLNLAQTKPVELYLFGSTAGYAYTFAFKKQYFVSASGIAGINMGLNNVDDKLHIYPAFFSRLSAGYNAESWSIGLHSKFDHTFVSFTKKSVASFNSDNVSLEFIKRF